MYKTTFHLKQMHCHSAVSVYIMTCNTCNIHCNFTVCCWAKQYNVDAVYIDILQSAAANTDEFECMQQSQLLLVCGKDRTKYGLRYKEPYAHKSRQAAYSRTGVGARDCSQQRGVHSCGHAAGQVAGCGGEVLDGQVGVGHLVHAQVAVKTCRAGN